jgi:DNA-binding PadR family transcriptional regulator
MPVTKRQAVVAALMDSDYNERTMSELRTVTGYTPMSLYPVLSWLETQQIITHRWSETDGHPTYSITDFPRAAVILYDTRSWWARFISWLTPGWKP